MTKVLRVVIDGRGLDLMSAFRRSTNDLWRELIVQTRSIVKGGMGPFKVASYLAELEKMKDAADDPEEILDRLGDLDQLKVVDGLTALVFLALRRDGDEVTYAEVAANLSPFEALGIISQAITAEPEDEPDPTTDR